MAIDMLEKAAWKKAPVATESIWMGTTYSCGEEVICHACAVKYGRVMGRPNDNDFERRKCQWCYEVKIVVPSQYGGFPKHLSPPPPYQKKNPFAK